MPQSFDVTLKFSFSRSTLPQVLTLSSLAVSLSTGHGAFAVAFAFSVVVLAEEAAGSYIRRSSITHSNGPDGGGRSAYVALVVVVVVASTRSRLVSQNSLTSESDPSRRMSL
jgi:hypothetical protein